VIGTCAAIRMLAFECRRLWKFTSGRSCASRNFGNQDEMISGSIGSPFHFVNSISLSTTLPFSSVTLRTHAEPIRNLSAFWYRWYSCSSSTQSAPMRRHLLPRLVFGALNTRPIPGMDWTVRLMESVPFSKSMSDQRRAQISPRRAPSSKAS